MDFNPDLISGLSLFGFELSQIGKAMVRRRSVLKRHFWRFSILLHEVSALRIPIYAGNAAFFLLLAFFPALMLALSLLPYLPVTAGDLSAWAMRSFPDAVHPLFSSIFEQRAVSAIQSVSVLILLYSASRGVHSILYGLDAVYGVTETRGFLKKQFLCIFFSISVIAALLIILSFQVFGRSLFAGILSNKLPVVGILHRLFRLRGLVSCVVLALLFAGIYTALPNCRNGYGKNLPGALFAAVVWTLFSSLFSLYADGGKGYSMIYGGITAVVLTMIWLYACMQILFYGGFINRLLAKRYT